MKYTVSFSKWFTYSEIEADTEEEAIERAEEFFKLDCCCPISDPTYDEVDTWQEKE